MKTSTDRILLGAILLLAAGLIWVVTPTLQVHITEIGDTAPDFKIVAENGKTYTRSDFGGKLLVLNFWASWCPPCIEETPSLNEFAKQYASQGVVVLGVSIDKNEKLYHNFLNRWHVAFETARDPESDISASYGTFLIPESYLIDRNGKVVEKFVNSTDWMDPAFLKRVQSML